MKHILTFVGLFIFLFNLSQTTTAQTASCLSFDGSDQYINASNTAFNAIDTADFTIEAWIKADPSSQNPHPMVVSNRPNTGSGVFLSFHSAWGGSSYKMLNLQIGTQNYFLINNGTFNGDLLDGQCHHVAVTRTLDSIYFYADGIHIGSKQFGWFPSTFSATDLLIGKDLPTNNTFNGHISQVRIWNVARSASEIATNKDLSISGTTPGLVGYWEMNEGTGQTIIDKTGVANGILGSSSATESTDPVWTSTGCCAVGTVGFAHQTTNTNTFTLFPNPSNTGLFNLQTEGELKDVQLEVFTISGSQISTIYNITPLTTIDLSNQAKGIYLLRLTTNGNTQTTRMIID